MSKEYKAIVSEVLTRQHGDKRYVVVDANGDVLDNNKGEGFATESKAITRYELKTFGHTSKDEEKRLSKKIKRHYE